MAVTVDTVYKGADTVWGNQRVKFRKVTLDNSYVQTGEPVTADQFGLREFVSLEPLGLALPSAGTSAWAVTAVIDSDRKGAKLFVHGQQPADTTSTSIAFPDADSTEDLSTFSVVMRAIGVGAA